MSNLDRDRLRELLQANNMTPRALSRIVGDNPYLVRDILAGKSRNPRLDTVQKLAAALGVPLAELQVQDGATAHVTTAEERAVRIAPRYLPVRYRVQAGHWIEAEPYVDAWAGPPNPIVPDPRYSQWPQWLEQVVGDSINLKIPEGGFAHVVDAIEMGYAPRSGDYVVVERRRGGGALRERTIKQVEVRSGRVMLWPRSTNPAWSEPLTLNQGAEGEEIEVEVVGLVIGAYSAF